MVEIIVRSPDTVLDSPVLVEGLPGVGLVGKIATDHIIEQRDMTYYADVTGEELPPVAVFDERDSDVKPPIRLFADKDNDLLALRSDVPVSAINAPAFAEDVTEWLDDEGVLPLYLSGLPTSREPDAIPSIFGVSTGDGSRHLDETDVESPSTAGMISGPAGALLSRARRRNLSAVGFVVETDPRFPDPQGARILIEQGINPVIGPEIDTAPLVEQAEEIMEQREQLAQQMREAAEHESSQASEISMYQ
ncbi:MAG: proteasome assembly chaperone family protein [Halobacteriales archaeon]